MGYALLLADKQWGGYTDVAKDFIGKVAGGDFQSDGTIRGGDNYNDVNPSYLAPAFYRAFAAYTGDSRWNTILNKSYDILNGAADPTTGLVPDWTSGNRNDYSYDAARTPFRIALDACWNNEPRAIAFSEKIGTFFAKIQVANIRDGYHLNGDVTGTVNNATFVGPAGVSGMVANEPQLVADAYAKVTKDLAEGTENYYNLSWALFTTLMMTGNCIDFAAP
jgi:endo-1,4-beta-D-glucanase Y